VSGYNSATPDSAIAAGQQGTGSPGSRAAGEDADGAGGGLPFTGLDAGLLALVGLALAGFGVLLRRLSAPPRQSG